jgi:acetyl esterase/lipase
MPIIKNLSYLIHSNHNKHTLDVYIPEEEGSFPVLLFVHGGSWYEGSKELYSQLGVHLSHKGFVAVVINYRLGAEAIYSEMAADCTAAVQWVAEAIDWYKGNPHQIFIAGHSAGGHLASLIMLNNKFLDEKFVTQHIKGCILIDAFGLNMDDVMKNNTTFFTHEMKKVFTNIPSNWEDAAPAHFLNPMKKVPFLILIGADTYPYLALDNAIFISQLDLHHIPNTHYTLNGKNHREMINSMRNDDDEAYDKIKSFVQISTQH